MQQLALGVLIKIQLQSVLSPLKPNYRVVF